MVVNWLLTSWEGILCYLKIVTIRSWVLNPSEHEHKPHQTKTYHNVLQICSSGILFVIN
jgi:hypothetical protein